MRALVLADFGRLEIHDLTEPQVQRDDDVLIEIAFTGICGTDAHGYTGANGRRVPGQVMGHESSGRILHAGPAARAGGLTEGRAVTFNPVLSCGQCPTCAGGAEQHCAHGKVIGVAPEIVASFAERLVVPAGNVVPLPESVPLAHGALAEPLAVGTQAVRQGGVHPGAAVFVSGGGPIGQAVVLAARRAGAEHVVVSEPVASRRELCQGLGATTIDPAAGDTGAQVHQVLAGPPTVAVDAVGVDATVADCLQTVALQGTVVLLGMATPQVTIPAFAVSTGQRHLVGSFCYSREVFTEAVGLLAPGAAAGSEPGTLISRQVTMDEAPDTFAQMAAGQIDPGKVLVQMTQG